MTSALALLPVFAVATKSAVDAGTVFYIVIIALIWLGSLVRSVSRAAAQRRARSAPGPASAGPTTKPVAPTGFSSSPLRVTTRIQITRPTRTGQTPQPIRIQLDSGGRPIPPVGVKSTAPVAAAAVGQLPQPDVPAALQLQDAISAFGGAAVAGEPAQFETPQPPAQVLMPLTSPAALVNAIVASAIVGPCAAYKPAEHDPMGW